MSRPFRLRSVDDMATLGTATNTQGDAEERARERLLAGVPVTKRHVRAAGIATVVLEGGQGPPVLLLHGPAANAAHWLRVIPDLVTTHHVVAPDLPGHGASEAPDDVLDAERAIAWLGELIERTCPSSPALVGYALGGAIAARFAFEHADRLSRLVLVDTFGLAGLEPEPDFGRALHDFFAHPTVHTHDALWRYCALDLDRLRRRMGDRWEPFRAYNVDRARRPSGTAVLGSLMQRFGLPAIPPADLARIAVPTTLIWGRHDLATRLSIAEAASARYGWPLHVIEQAADDPPIEAPESFVHALRTALDTTEGAST
jgi:pimeloyl-ACP methyl ester carboxylesterase